MRNLYLDSKMKAKGELYVFISEYITITERNINVKYRILPLKYVVSAQKCPGYS